MPASLNPAADSGHIRPRLLMIRPSALGDVCRTIPALVTIRNSMPQGWIDWLVADDFIDAVRYHPALNGIMAFPRRRFGKAWFNPFALNDFTTFARSITLRNYDWVVDLQGLFRSGYFARRTKAPVRLGFSNAREFGWIGYNRRINIDPTLHSVDRMLSLLYKDGFGPTADMRLYVGPNDEQWLSDWLAQRGGNDQPYACIAPTARWRCKCWPIDRYIDITRRLLQTKAAGERVIVLASPSEQKQVEPMRDAFGGRDDVLFPSTTVGQMMALISKCKLLVCNDSAPMHIAVGFNRPMAALFGPTDPALVGPYRRDDAVIRDPQVASAGPIRYRRHKNNQKWIASISVDTVWQKIEQQLKRDTTRWPSTNWAVSSKLGVGAGYTGAT